MKYIKNYDLWGGVEENESISSISATTGHEIVVNLFGDDIFNINNDRFAILKTKYQFNGFINIDNKVYEVDYHSPVGSYAFVLQPVYFTPHNESDGFATFIKFEQTREEPILWHYNNGSSSKNSIKGKLTLEDGTVFNDVYLSRESDISLWFAPGEEIDGEAYEIEDNTGWHIECSRIYADGVQIIGYKVTSVTPGVAYCKENKKVLYNDTWKSVTISSPRGAKKLYTKNYVTREEIINDLNLPGDAYLSNIDANVVEIYDGYAFLKESNGKEYMMRRKE